MLTLWAIEVPILELPHFKYFDDYTCIQFFFLPIGGYWGIFLGYALVNLPQLIEYTLTKLKRTKKKEKEEHEEKEKYKMNK